MMRWIGAGLVVLGLSTCRTVAQDTGAARLERMAYHNPGLEVDLGVGLWALPLPMDWDGDGDLDLVVSNPDKPNNATWLFENPGPAGARHPVFKPPVRVGRAYPDLTLSVVNGVPRLLNRNEEIVDWKATGFDSRRRIYPQASVHDAKLKVREQQWKYVDFDADGDQDLVAAYGDWSAYGWDNAYNAKGEWTNGPLHGYVYLIRNDGSDAEPKYAEPAKLEAGGQAIDVFGRPSPNFADFDGDGDLDLVCGEFLDRMTYFANVGSRTKPEYAAGRRVADADGHDIVMNLEMIVPVAIDWDGDGDCDLIVGDEDGRVALVEHTGQVVDGLPRFLPPFYFRQEAADLKFGALCTPDAADWDGDGDTDLVVGNSAGELAWFENLGGEPVRWSAPVRLEAGGEPFRIMAGPNGSIQGPAEAKWGYLVVDAADWDGDGDTDIMYNSIWGRIGWLENVGSKTAPTLAAPKAIEVEWTSAEPPKPSWTWWTPEGKSLATQWRTSPRVADLTGDGLADLIVLDHEGYLALFERFRQADGTLALKPGRRAFDADGPSVFNSGHGVVDSSAGLLRLNNGFAGASGRRQWCLTDWDADGRLDLLANSVNANLMRGVEGAPAGSLRFHESGQVDARLLGGHATCPTMVDLDGDGRPELIVGAEDGFLYRLVPPRP
jgi:hypothetical protein